MTSNQDLRTVKSIADGLAKNEFSSREMTALCLDRIERTDGAVKAFITVTAETALAAADASDERRRAGRPIGPLDGVPYAAKDLFETKGIETTGSSDLLKGYVPNRSATVVDRLAAAGAVLVGKANTHQFGYGVQTPPTRNPWDGGTARVPGGSSGGTGAAIAAGQAAFGIGTDGGGSVRIPACLNGITGLKATFGRISKFGALVLSYSFDHVGPLAWTVEDVALALDVMAGHDPRDPNSSKRPTEDYTAALSGGVRGLRVAVPTNYFVSHYPAVAGALQDSLDVLKGLGAEVIQVAVPKSVEMTDPAGFGIALAESAAYHAPHVRANPGGYRPDVLSFIKTGEFILATDWINASRYRTRICAEMRQLWDDQRIDVMATPTVAVTAAPHGQMEYTAPDGFTETLMSASIRCTYPFNLTGQPALTVPNGRDEGGLPTGLQIVGRPWAEAMVLRVGHAYQQATDWHTRRPDLAWAGA